MKSKIALLLAITTISATSLNAIVVRYEGTATGVYPYSGFDALTPNADFTLDVDFGSTPYSSIGDDVFTIFASGVQSLSFNYNGGEFTFTTGTNQLKAWSNTYTRFGALRKQDRLVVGEQDIPILSSNLIGAAVINPILNLIDREADAWGAGGPTDFSKFFDGQNDWDSFDFALQTTIGGPGLEFNGGIHSAQVVNAPPSGNAPPNGHAVPDTSSTALLGLIGFTSLIAIRKRFKK